MMSWFKSIYLLYLAAVLPLLAIAVIQYKDMNDFGMCLTAFGGQGFVQQRTATVCSQIFTETGMVVKDVGSDEALLLPMQTQVHRSTYRDIYAAAAEGDPEAMSGAPAFELWWAQLPVTRVN
ncbi:hypothetical protein [Aeromonas caviae]|uniref:hypothetical protein n=1 Tax=Aeromonas caviae TaxID=648 RepID=UPI002B498AB0|nr:hypothetical protein [Aeromonas caviae]